MQVEPHAPDVVAEDVGLGGVALGQTLAQVVDGKAVQLIAVSVVKRAFPGTE